MITIYINGCVCGQVGQQVRRVKAYARNNMEDVEVKNTRYDKEALLEHTRILWEELDVKGSYPPIVREGNTVTRLLDWNK